MPDQPLSALWSDEYSDMHAIVAQLVIPDGLPQRAVSVITTARELIRHSYCKYEFTADGLVDEEELDMLHTGRVIRTGIAHGKTTHSVLKPPLAVSMAQASISALALLCGAPTSGRR